MSNKSVWLKVIKTIEKQQVLIISLCLPCILLALFCMHIANISWYLIAFIAITAMLCLGYVVVASRSETQYQINTMSNLIEAMIDGDYSMRGRLNTNQALNEISRLLNSLSSSLAKHKLEAKESRMLLEIFIDQMDAMVVATDEDGFVVMANKSAKSILLNDEPLLSTIHFPTLDVGRTIVGSESEFIQLDNQRVSGEFLVIKERFFSQGNHHCFYIISDAQRLLIEKERKSWQGLLRVLSHEMNNSLTPIIAVSQQMAKKLASDPSELSRESMSSGVGLISERAQSLSSFIATYSELTHLPTPQKVAFNFKAMIDGITLLFSDCRFTIKISKEFELYGDKKQIEQVLVNIIKNAIESMDSVEEPMITITCNKNGKQKSVIISDVGTGITNADNLFVPFYTTKPSGNGIGLALCRQIMFNHGGSIQLANNNDNVGAHAQLIFPSI